MLTFEGASRRRRRCSVVWFLATLCLLSCVATSAEAQQGKRMTVEQVVDRALNEGLEIAENEAEIQSARSTLKATKALYGPRVMVEGSALYFNAAPTFAFDMDMGTLPPTYQAMFGSLLGEMDAGEQYMIDFRVTLAQPLTKLEAIHELATIKRLDVEIAENKGEGTKARVAHEARGAAYGLMKLREAVATLEETEREVLAREEQVKAFAKAELVGRQEVLEVGVKLAELRQTLIKLRAFEEVSVARVRQIARLEPAANVRLVVPTAMPDVPPIEECIQRAMEGRPELAELRLRREQARAGVRAKTQEFVPDVSIIATYQYQAGSAFGQPELAAGAVMSWTPFAWGETYHAVRAMKASVRQVDLALQRVEELLALDVRRAHAEAVAARESIAAAQTAREQAEELLRIEQARFEVHDNTATDLLGAQTALLRARTAEQSARYDYLTALSGLNLAMGTQ